MVLHAWTGNSSSRGTGMSRRKQVNRPAVGPLPFLHAGLAHAPLALNRARVERWRHKLLARVVHLVPRGSGLYAHLAHASCRAFSWTVASQLGISVIARGDS